VRVSGVFRNEAGRLRSGWRVAIWTLAVILLGLAAQVLLSVVGAGSRTAGAVATALSVALASLAAWRFLEGRAPGDTPLALGRPAASGFGLGLGVGVALVALVVVVLGAAGAYQVARSACTLTGQGGFLARSLLLFLFAALAEELLFRGYPLFALREGLGGLPAALVTALLFALAHAANPHFGWGAMVGVAWIGAVLALWVLATGTVWGAVGAHLGWNAALVAGAAMPVSGLRFRAPCHQGELSGPAWLTGGGFGVEAGLVAAVAWAIAGALVLARARRKPR
jgi:membrane protease YdiL (CAAX protease family)